jgi:4-hydroxyacetophenone monooxygenase
MDESFIRNAVDRADLSALRMALFQATGNPEVGAMELERAVVRGGAGVLPVVPERYHARLKELAVDYLVHGAADHVQQIPDDESLGRMISMVEGHDVPEELLFMRRGLLCFDEFPRRATWSDGKPELPDDFSVVIVGAGFSGIAMGVQLGLLGIPYVVLERRTEVGGVWSINTYPDARVDTLSVTYQFGFEKNYPWSEHFARQGEVLNYLEYIAKKYGVYEHIRFEHDVTTADFDETTNSWQLQVATADGQTHDLSANVVVSAAGLFATPKPLDIKGADQFAGELLHTTAWGTDHTPRGKRVAVIGNGSTGVQLLARVAEQADQVYVFQRTPQWISPRENYGQPITPEAQWLLDTMPYYWNWSRYTAVIPLFGARELLEPDDEWIAGGGHVNARSDSVRDGLTAYIKAQVGNRPDLIDKLIPDYAPIARRPVVDNNWYKTLTRTNVELVTTPITHITDTGIATEDGDERPVDMIIAAVGFQTGRYLFPTKYRGVGGVTLDEQWREQGAQAYIGMTVPHFPNLFIMYGPNSQPISGGAALPSWYEIWSRYIGQTLVAMIEGGHSRVEVREDVHDTYNDLVQETASKLIYITDEGSRDKNYYVNEFGRLQVNIPWEGEDYYLLCAAPNLEDFAMS